MNIEETIIILKNRVNNLLDNDFQWLNKLDEGNNNQEYHREKI